MTVIVRPAPSLPTPSPICSISPEECAPA
jgi:hypothetical protein